MTREDLFEVLGELDDDIVKEAKFSMKKRAHWKIWGAMAACLTLTLVLGVILLCSQHGGRIPSEPGVADVAPMVYVNDTLFIQSSDQQGYPEFKDEFIYLGQILRDITQNQGDGTDGVPKENFQANHPIVGCEVYQYGENIVVKIHDAYWLYMKYGEPEVSWDALLEAEKEPSDPAQNKCPSLK